MAISQGLGYFESLDFDWALADEHMLGPDHPCADTASTNSTRTFAWESETLPPSQSRTTYLTFSPNQILDIPTRSHSFYTIASRTVDTVFPTLLHLLIRLQHNTTTSLPKLSVTLHPTCQRTFRTQRNTGAPQWDQRPIPLTRPKVYMSQTFHPRSTGVHRYGFASSTSILCHGSMERSSTAPTMGTHHPATPTAHPAPCQEVRGHLPAAAPTPRMRDGRRGWKRRFIHLSPQHSPGGGVAHLRGAW